MVTQEQILESLRNVMHPELERSLVGLRMVREIDVRDNEVVVSLAVPFKEIPIKDELVKSVEAAVHRLAPSVDVKVELVEMGQTERAAFMAQAEGKPPSAKAVNKIAHVIAVLSGKGGVGKSSVAALLAVSLSRRGMRVGVLDADITGPSQPQLFGLDQAPMMSPLGIRPVESENGIKVMSINLLLPDKDQAVIWRGPMISNAIKQFWNDVVWGDLDCLVVDLPPGTSDASLTVMQSIPLSGVILVTSPQDLAGMVVRKAAGMAERLGAPILGLVENMSYILCPDCGRQIEAFGPSQVGITTERLGIPLLGRLPLDPELARSCDRGRVEVYGGRDFAPIADLIVERMPALQRTDGIAGA
ncbi:MAG: Mrp/NBP35 family ATP-binding protein [Anaerolineae bacterium]|nr:Mrp/NBP35 family ATP-binding protein [Anaerolineae bacterium]